MHALGTARPIAAACLGLTIFLSIVVESAFVRTAGIALTFVATWILYEVASRVRTRDDEPEGYGGSDRRRNPLLRTLTDQMLVQVRELYRTAESIRVGEKPRADGESELNRLERDMSDLVRKMRRSASLQYEAREAKS